VVLVGHTSSDETNDKLAQERVDDAAAIITAGTGICLSIPKTQVQVRAPGADQNGVPYESGFCRSSVGPMGPNTEMRRVEVWFVPSAGRFRPRLRTARASAGFPSATWGARSKPSLIMGAVRRELNVPQPPLPSLLCGHRRPRNPIDGVSRARSWCEPLTGKFRDESCCRTCPIFTRHSTADDP
jgi:hypothetical protein